MRSAKNKMLLDLSELGIRHRLDGPISDCKSVDMLLRAIAQNSQEFKPIRRNLSRWLVEESVAGGKDNFLNLGTDDFYEGRHRSKCTQRRSSIKNIYNRICTLNM